MYSDISGMSPELINVVKLIGAGLLAIGQITVGVLALTTSMITLPVAISVFLVSAGTSAIMDMVAIGRAQYNFSLETGQEDGEIFDDVVDSVGSNSLDMILYHATMRTVYISAELGVGSAIALLLEAKDPTYVVSYNKNYSRIPWITVITTAYRSYNTGRTFFDNDFAYDYATSLGWIPWED